MNIQTQKYVAADLDTRTHNETGIVGLVYTGHGTGVGHGMQCYGKITILIKYHGARNSLALWLN